MVIILQGKKSPLHIYDHSIQVSNAIDLIGMTLILKLGKVVMLKGNATTLLGVVFFFLHVEIS